MGLKDIQCCQARPKPLVFGREIRFEDAGKIFFGDAAAIITDGYAEVRSISFIEIVIFPDSSARPLRH